MMRRLIVLTLLTLVGAAVLAGAAAAKDMSVSLGGGGEGIPSELPSGEPWNAELLVHGEADMLAEARPGITTTNSRSGNSETFVARPTGSRAPDGQLLYRARVVFPEDGVYEYGIVDGVTDRVYEGGTIRVGSPPVGAPAPSPAQPSAAPAAANESNPWAPGLVGGGLLALLLAGAGALVVRRRRPQPTV